MPDVMPRIEPFESASELRDAHAALLARIDDLVDDNATTGDVAAAVASLDPQIREFLERGSATGAFLEEIKERTACTVLLDYWVSALTQANRPVARARLARFDADQLPDLADTPCPYVGLDAFRSDAYFFGRESDTAALVKRVRETPLVIVLGASGSGKSSLVLGGVLPALKRDDGFRVMPEITPGAAVLVELARAAASLRGDAPDADAVAHAVADLHEKPAHLLAMIGSQDAHPVVITIDQFEEVFTLAKPADRSTLVSSLAAALDAGHRVILTVREEFRSRLVELLALGRYLDRAWYSMRPMGYDELRAAVERPAAAVNLQFQPGIVDDLVKKVLGQPAALPLLQFTLRALWQERDRNRITREVYQKVGDPLTALETAADRFYDGLPPQTQDEVRRVLLELVRVDELLEAYRQPVPQQRLLASGRANTVEVIELLQRADFVRLSAGHPEHEGDIIVEVKHESLVRNWPRYVGWIDEKRTARRQRLSITAAAEQWDKSKRPAAGLLTGWQIDEAKRFDDLSPLENEFVEESARALDSERKQREQALIRERNVFRAGLVIAVVMAAVVGAATLYFEQRSKALEAERVELKRQAEVLLASQKALEDRYAVLQRQYADLFAKSARAALAPTDRPVTILLHISKDSQRPRAESIKTQLVQSKFLVPGIERVDPVTQSNVRYFYASDAAGAKEIAGLLEEILGVGTSTSSAAPEATNERASPANGGAGRIPTVLVRGYEGKVPDRRYEIWFGVNDLPPAADEPGR